MNEKQSFLKQMTPSTLFKGGTNQGLFRIINESIRNKLLVAILALSLIPLILLGVISFNTASNALNQKAFDQLEAVRDSKATTIQNYFAEREGDMAVLVETVGTLRQEAFDQLEVGQALKTDEIEGFITGLIADARFARNLVVVKGTEGVNEGLPVLAQYKNDQSNPAYIEAFERAQSVLTSYARENGYVDIMMADTTGSVVFALDEASRNTDESSSIDFQQGLADTYVGDLIYIPEHNEIHMRVTIPVLDQQGQTVGVLFLETKPDKINGFMTERTGLGETGETYLVGPDKLFRSDSRFVTESTILNPDYVVDTQAVNEALAGRAGQGIILDYRGEPVLSTWTPITVGNSNWILIAEIDVEEAFSSKIEGAEKDFFTQYKETYGYYDLFLFEPNGYLFYTVIHEPDYQTNLLTGPYKDTNLGRLVAEVRETKSFGLADFEKYAPSADAPAAFIAQPVLHEGNIEIIVALQLPLDQINTVLQEQSGLGESGETYVVGQDSLWRSDSRFLEQLGTASTVLNADYEINTVASQGALAGESGIQVIDDYRGVPVLSAWTPITLVEPNPDHPNPEGITWALMAEIDQAEVQQSVVTLTWVTGGLVVVAAVLVVLVALVLSGALTRQVNVIVDLFEQINIGNYEARTEVLTQDELGSMAASLNTMLDTILTQINALTDLFSDIGIGDFEARVEVMSNDPIGQMATALNAMLDNTLALVQTSEERDDMQASMMTLLDEISGIAEGDLTREAEVKADITGAIADAFNFTILQLRDIIGNVQNATQEVSSSAGEIQTTAEHLAEGSESQAAQIIETSAAIEEMAVSIQQVSENAVVSATVAEQALVNAQQGTQAVHNTIEGMDRIRDQVQETSKRIKRLGESSQEIGEIVQVISDIADRTSILALNASIQAAMAGEAGRGFAVVAEEVERLAERSAEATRQIEGLVKTIQSETTETVTAMEESTREVVEGSQLANEAGRALGEIETVSNRLAELIQSISQAAKQQARGSEAVASSMSEIAEVTQETAAGTKQASVSISSLAVLADNLSGSVSTFKLPTNGHKA